MPEIMPDNAIIIIASYLPVISLMRVSMVNKQAASKTKEILELPLFANIRRYIILRQLCARRVWPSKDWMDLVKLGRFYDRIYKDGFYPTGYDMLEFIRENPSHFFIETKTRYRPMIWNIHVHGDPDK
jgi:hypothetical protein